MSVTRIFDLFFFPFFLFFFFPPICTFYLSPLKVLEHAMKVIHQYHVQFVEF